MGLTGSARVAGVMGWPVAHSRSPLLHGHWLETCGIDGAYVPLAVPPHRFEAAFRALPFLGFRGCNVTLPHKEKALALADSVDDLSRRIGAANTIVVADDGSLAATNTDAFGFLENLKSRAPGWRRDRPALVLGAGGSARAVVVALLDEGVREVRIANRTLERAEALVERFGPSVTTVLWEERTSAGDGVHLVVNTTQLGMTGQPELDFALDGLEGEAVVCDLVYAPLVTDLLHRARQRGHVTVDGLGMLLHQARPGFAAWFGVDPTVTEALRSIVSQGL